MTIKQAVKWQKYFKKTCRVFPKEVNEACNMAISALENREPRMPIYSSDGYSDGVEVFDIAYCPSCDHCFEYECGNDWGNKFCLDCGQALEWNTDEIEVTE